MCVFSVISLKKKKKNVSIEYKEKAISLGGGYVSTNALVRGAYLLLLFLFLSHSAYPGSLRAIDAVKHTEHPRRRRSTRGREGEFFFFFLIVH